MADLVQCFECGKSISSSASSCPHCRLPFPHGMTCAVCDVHGKFSEMVSREKPSIRYQKYCYFHQRCLDAVLNTDARCETCKKPLAPLESRECRNCGQYLGRFLKDCHYCGQFVHNETSDFRGWHEYDYHVDSQGDLINRVTPKASHALCCATGERQQYQERRQADAAKFMADQKQERERKAAQAAAEQAAPYKRIQSEKQRRVANNRCPICGKGFSKSIFSQLINPASPKGRERDLHLGIECFVHEGCLNRQFQW